MSDPIPLPDGWEEVPVQPAAAKAGSPVPASSQYDIPATVGLALLIVATLVGLGVAWRRWSNPQSLPTFLKTVYGRGALVAAAFFSAWRWSTLREDGSREDFDFVIEIIVFPLGAFLLLWWLWRARKVDPEHP